MAQSRKYLDFQATRTIVLVGMMGAGKTTIGRRLAPRLGLPFIDADQEIEIAAGMSVSELFSHHGEASFRKGEAQVIRRLLDGAPHVLSTGGGALLNPDTQQNISDRSVSIWLKADLETIVERAGQRNNRPLLQTGDPMVTLARLMEERAPLYAMADLHVESQPGPHTNTVNLIIDVLGDYFDAKPAHNHDHFSTNES